MEQENTQQQNEGATSSFSQLVDSINIAEDLDEQQLSDIGSECKRGFDNDFLSRDLWEKDLEEWTKLAMQVREPKSWPWRDASNVKYPLLSTAAMQFNARAYPSLIPSDGKVVKTKVIGKDPNGMKLDKADRISTYMSYQFMYEMTDWDEEMDKMLIMLPIVGTVFKKTYWDGDEKKIVSKLVLPMDLVVNNWAKNIDEAERVSQIFEMSQRLVEERKRQGIFLDIDLGAPAIPAREGPVHIPAADETTPYVFVEQHTYLDLDEDGYKEPYIVTFERDTGRVMRISARFRAEDVELDDKDKVVKIVPTQHYTKFSFVPNPDGSFYDIGFGVLLGPINEAVNTLINQLVDAGTINNLQGGFIGKGLKLKAGENKVAPGEWKPVAVMGDDLRKQIVPLPSKEPSNVLFQLMGSLITSGKELASVAEIFVGKMPGQNTPATTTMATIEQGMKVFTAVYKRIYRSLEKEFKKVYKLNAIYTNPETYISVLDIPVGPEDFNNEDYDICPGADPTAVSQTEKLLKAQGLLELMPMMPGMLNPVEVVSRVLQAQEQPNWEQLFTPEVQQSGMYQPPPDPKQAEMEMKMQIEQHKNQRKAEYDQFKMEVEGRQAEQKIHMEQQMHNMEMQHKSQMANLEGAVEVHKQRIFMAAEQNKAQTAAVQNEQKIRHGEQAHQQKMQQSKENAKLSAKQTSKPGSKAK